MQRNMLGKQCCQMGESSAAQLEMGESTVGSDSEKQWQNFDVLFNFSGQSKSQAMEVGLEEEKGEEEDSQEEIRDREEEEETGGGEKQDGEGAYVTFEDEEHCSQHRRKREENNNLTANR
jgi:hypothetical protein